MHESIKKNNTLLIVDDDPATRHMLMHTLDDHGYKFIEAENGLQALEQFNKHCIDLILMDVQMPKLDGIGACARIRELDNNDVPIIIMTGMNDSEVVEASFDAGATEFITKPINCPLLAQRIRYALRNETLKQEIQKSQIELNRAQTIAQMGHWHFDVSKMLMSLSVNTRHLYNFTENDLSEIKFQNFLDFLPAEYSKGLEHNILMCIKQPQESKKSQFELLWRYNNKNNEDRFIELHWETECDENGGAIRLNGISQDITDRKRAEATIEHQAFYDHLTNLPNRRLFVERLKQGIHYAERSEQLMAVVFIDCDRFKPINDALGHKAGDALLISIADRLKGCVYTQDTVCRVSGDEFALLLENIKHIDDVERVVKNIIKAISEPHQLMENKVFTSVSVGIALHPFDCHGNSDLLALADMAMYHAKKNGGNQYKYYNAQMNVENSERNKLEQDLRDALNNNELLLYYQPQNYIDEKRKMVGVEALLRWQHPEKGLIPPLEFISIAEETGLIVEIGEWVIKTACLQVAAWKKQGFGDIRMGVNLSPRQFNQTNLDKVIKEAISYSGIKPEFLDLEITESVSMLNIESTIKILNKFKKIGVRVSLDDFGTGYSSLSYLQKMPIDTLKIDRAFIRNLHKNKKDQAFVVAIITMAHSLGMEVIAEGVELEEQFEFLKTLNCEMAQGYMFSPPVPVDELTPFLLSIEEHCK